MQETLECIFNNQKLIIDRQSEIARALDVVNKRLMKVENSVEIQRSRSNETKAFVRRGHEECISMLKSCREAFRNSVNLAEMQIECSEDLANSVSVSSDWS